MSRTLKAIERHMTQPSKSEVVERSAPKLVGEWQSGPEDLLGYAQTKLRLSFAPVPAQLPTNNSYEHAIYSGNGNGHLPLWWIRR